MTTPDFLARPEDETASLHRPRPFPRYCLKQCGSAWYMVPIEYEFGFSAYVKAWRDAAEPDDDGVTCFVPYPSQKDLPRYVIPTNLDKLTFEKPIEKAD